MNGLTNELVVSEVTARQLEFASKLKAVGVDFGEVSHLWLEALRCEGIRNKVRSQMSKCAAYDHISVVGDKLLKSGKRSRKLVDALHVHYLRQSYPTQQGIVHSRGAGGGASIISADFAQGKAESDTDFLNRCKLAGVALERHEVESNASYAMRLQESEELVYLQGELSVAEDDLSNAKDALKLAVQNIVEANQVEARIKRLTEGEVKRGEGAVGIQVLLCHGLASDEGSTDATYLLKSRDVQRLIRLKWLADKAGLVSTEITAQMDTEGAKTIGIGSKQSKVTGWSEVESDRVRTKVAYWYFTLPSCGVENLSQVTPCKAIAWKVAFQTVPHDRLLDRNFGGYQYSSHNDRVIELDGKVYGLEQDYISVTKIQRLVRCNPENNLNGNVPRSDVLATLKRREALSKDVSASYTAIADNSAEVDSAFASVERALVMEGLTFADSAKAFNALADMWRTDKAKALNEKSDNGNSKTKGAAREAKRCSLQTDEQKAARRESNRRNMARHRAEIKAKSTLTPASVASADAQDVAQEDYADAIRHMNRSDAASLA